MSIAKFEALLGYFSVFHSAMMAPSNRGVTRLMVNMLMLLGAFEDCPSDVADWLESEISQVYDAACSGRLIPLRVPGVIFTVSNDGTIILDCLRSSLCYA